MLSIERCRIEDFNKTVAILFYEDFGISHYDSHPSNIKKLKHKCILKCLSGVHQSKPSATLQSHVAWQGSLLCRIHQELAKTALLPPTIHEKSERQSHRIWTPIGQLASRWKSCFADFLGRICFALAILSRWYCPHDSYVNAECLRTQMWVLYSASGQWNHISAWNVIFLLVAHFEMSIEGMHRTGGKNPSYYFLFRGFKPVYFTNIHFR